MTKNQLAQYAMMKASVQVLNDNKSHWKDLKPVAAEVTTLTGLLAVIATASQAQFEGKTNGFTSQKDAAMDLMNDLGHTMALRLASWARKHNHDVVLTASKFSRSALETGPEAEQIIRIANIVKLATAHLTELADYKVTAAQVSDLKAAVDAATPLAAVRDAVGSNRQAATGNIAITLKQAMAVLDAIDDLLESMLEPESQSFEDAYFAARNIISRRGAQRADADS